MSRQVSARCRPVTFRPMITAPRRDPGAEAGTEVVDTEVVAADVAALDAIAQRGPELLERLREL